MYGIIVMPDMYHGYNHVPYMFGVLQIFRYVMRNGGDYSFSPNGFLSHGDGVGELELAQLSS